MRTTTQVKGLVVLVLLAMAEAWSQPLGAQPAVPPDAPRPDGYYAAGNRIEIGGPMVGDVVVAGRTIVIGQPVAGDILAAGWHVTLSAAAADDVRMAAGTVAVNAPVSGDLTVAGGDVTTGAGTRVRGRAFLTGDTVRVGGAFERDVQIAARVVFIGGEVRQPLRVVAERLEFLPDARILGPVSYRGVSPAVVAAGAQVNGPIAFEPIQRREAEDARAWPALSTMLFAAHLFIAGLLTLYIAPRFQSTVVGTMRKAPGKSLLAGFLLLVTIPVLAVVLVFSVLGLPIGVALGMCFLLALFAGLLATTFFLGDVEGRLLKAGPFTTRGQRALLLLAGVLTLAVLRLLLGGLVVFVSTLFGLGALTLWLLEQYAPRPQAQPAAV